MSSCRECGGPLVPIKDITAWCPNCREADIADDLCRYITELEADNKTLKRLAKEFTGRIEELRAENKRLKEDYIALRDKSDGRRYRIERLEVERSLAKEEAASLLSTLAQVRKWVNRFEITWEGSVMVVENDLIDLDSILSADHEVLAVVDGVIDWDGEGSHQVACLYARLPGKHWEHGKKYPVTVTRRKED